MLTSLPRLIASLLAAFLLVAPRLGYAQPAPTPPDAPVPPSTPPEPPPRDEAPVPPETSPDVPAAPPPEEPSAPDAPEVPPAEEPRAPEPPLAPEPPVEEEPNEDEEVWTESPVEASEEDVGPIEITVVGTRIARTAGSAHVIGKRQLERFEYDDAHAVLLQVPGVYVRQEDGVGLRPNIGIRGVNPDRSKKLTLMEDGVLFGPAPYSAPAAYYFPLMTRMTQVRVIKGPGAVAYGPQTIGGAIDLGTRAIPTLPSGGLDLAGGEYGYGKAHAFAGASNEQFGFLFEGVHLRNTGFMELDGGGNTGSTRNEWMVKGSYVVDPRARVRSEFGVKLTYSDEGSNETYLGLTDADFRVNPYRRYAASANDRMEFHRTSVVLSHVLDDVENDIQVKTQVYRHDLTRSWSKLNRFQGFRGNESLFSVLRNPDDPTNALYYGVLTGEYDTVGAEDTLRVGPNHRTFVSQGMQVVASAKPTTGPLAHRIEGGLRLHYDSVERRHTEDNFAMQNGRLVAEGQTFLTTENMASTFAAAMHVLDAVTWKRLTLTPGVRVELIRSRAEDQLTGDAETVFTPAILPGVGAFVALTDDFGLLAGVHRGFSPPAPGSPGVDPEWSVNYEAGARFVRGRARAELIGFYNQYSNLTNICTASTGCVTDNLDRQFDAGRARIYGFEAFAEHEIEVGPLRVPIRGSYTLTQAEFLTSFESLDPIYGNVSRGDFVPYVPRHQWNATLGVEADRAGGNVAFNYVAAMREEAGSAAIADSLATDEQFWIDLESRFRVVGKLFLYGTVRNLLNAQNIVARRPFGARVNAPRWVQVGAKMEF